MRPTKQRRSISLVATLCLSGFGVMAQTRQSLATDETLEAPKTGVITGRVVNDSGQAIPNASVSVRAMSSSAIMPRGTATGSDGSFQISGLEPALYFVSAQAPGYTTVALESDETQPSYHRIGDSVTINMTKGGVITGTVATGTGEAVVAITVRAVRVRDAKGLLLKGGFPPTYERLTDDRGIYRIYGLRPGAYVVGTGGRGPSGVFSISPYDGDVPIYSPSSTRDTALEVTVRAGEEISGIDIRYRSEPGHSVSGAAKGSLAGSSNSAGFGVTLTGIVNGAPQSSSYSFQAPGSNGFSFYGIADGDYDLTAQSSVAPGDTTVSAPRRISVKGSDVTGIELFTQPLGSISGHLTLEASKAPECQGKRRPLFSETIVSTRRDEKDNRREPGQMFSFTGGQATLDKTGDFVLRNLAPGRYEVRTRFFARYWYLQSVSMPPARPATVRTPFMDLSRNWLNLKVGERLAGINIVLAEGAASLRGQVTVGEGEKLPPKLFVYLLPAEREKPDDVLRFYAAPVGADGAVSLSNLAPGRYKVFAEPLADSDASPITKIRRPDETETRAKLRRSADVAKTEIEFKQCQNVTDYQLTLKASPAKQPTVP